MKKSDAISYFGNQQRLADALERAPSTISEWPDFVPLEAAFLLECMTKGRKNALRLDPSLYPKLPKQFLSRREAA
jgi:hypothetical protein